MIKGAIFDIDGTLLDSMPVWENAGARYLATLGIKARSDLKERLDALSLPEGALYMQTEYKLSVTIEEILEGVNQVVKDFYFKEEHLQTKKEETWVFEDSLYAVKTASKAGFPVCSIYDAYSRDNTEEIRTFSDIYVKDFYEIESCQVFQRKKQQLHRLSERR